MSAANDDDDDDVSPMPNGSYSFGIKTIASDGTTSMRPRRCERMGAGGYVCLLMPGHIGPHEWTPFTNAALDAHFKASEQ